MVEITKKYCFHHVPKTAGSSLQLRLAHREWIGELPADSTLVVYPFRGDTRFYRVSEDPDFKETNTIRQAFERTYLQPRTQKSSSIVMGHMTTVGQAGDHYTWLRHPLKRDISHFNFDMKTNNAMADNFYDHMDALMGNFMVQWFWKHYLGRMDSPPFDKKYETVRRTLENKFVRIWDSSNFETSWDFICDQLGISKEPRLNSNEVGKDYVEHFNISDIREGYAREHKQRNEFDYLLYEEFAR